MIYKEIFNAEVGVYEGMNILKISYMKKAYEETTGEFTTFGVEGVKDKDNGIILMSVDRFYQYNLLKETIQDVLSKFNYEDDVMRSLFGIASSLETLGLIKEVEVIDKSLLLNVVSIWSYEETLKVRKEVDSISNVEHIIVDIINPIDNNIDMEFKVRALQEDYIDIKNILVKNPRFTKKHLRDSLLNKSDRRKKIFNK